MPYYVVQHMKISVRLNCLSIEHHELPSSSCLPSCLKLLRLSRWIILSILDFCFSILNYYLTRDMFHYSPIVIQDRYFKNQCFWSLFFGNEPYRIELSQIDNMILNYAFTHYTKEKCFFTMCVSDNWKVLIFVRLKISLVRKANWIPSLFS